MRTVTVYRAILDGVDMAILVSDDEMSARESAMNIQGPDVQLVKKATYPFVGALVEVSDDGRKAIDSLGELDYCDLLVPSAQDDPIKAAAKRRARALLGKD